MNDCVLVGNNEYLWEIVPYDYVWLLAGCLAEKSWLANDNHVK